MTGAEMRLDLELVDSLDLGALTDTFEQTIRSHSAAGAGYNPQELADSLAADVIAAVMAR